MEYISALSMLQYPEISTLRLPALVTVLVYALNARSGMAVGNARHKHKVSMPNTEGPPEFMRAFRAHSNNAEQYPQFLALMWVTAILVDGIFAGSCGLFWVVMRHMYVTRYHRTAEGLLTYTIPAYLSLSLMSIVIMAKVTLSFLKDFGLI